MLSSVIVESWSLCSSFATVDSAGHASLLDLVGIEEVLEIWSFKVVSIIEVWSGTGSSCNFDLEGEESSGSRMGSSDFVGIGMKSDAFVIGVSITDVGYAFYEEESAVKAVLIVLTFVSVGEFPILESEVLV